MIKRLTILLIICSLFGCKQSDNERSKIYYSLEEIPNNDKFGMYHSLDKLPRNLKKVKTLWVEIKSKDQLNGFEKLVNLRNLDGIIRDQDILNELIIKASKLENLTLLSLQIWGVDSISESLGKLTQLKSLDIAGSFSKLPENIGELNNLRSLFIRGTKLNELPESFVYLKNLERLNLSNNCFTTIPNEILEFDNLIELNMNDNNISVIPDKITGLKNLNYLYLNNNNISFMPKTLGKLTLLYSIHFDTNSISQTDKDYLRELEKRNTDNYYALKSRKLE